MDDLFDIIVVGGGHAGCEAALSSSRIGCSTLLLTSNLDTLALMPCNPSIGGLAKGHLVCEIDSLGGEMGRCIDKTGIQFRMLNTSKGPAVRAIRVQADKALYRLEMKSTIEQQECLTLKQETVSELIVKRNTVHGVITEIGSRYMARAVILALGTFLNGKIHIGLDSFKAGRAGEPACASLSKNLQQLGFSTGRLKTGTCPRLNSKTIDFSNLIIQKGDPEPKTFSGSKVLQSQVPCYITYTNNKTHEIIKKNLDRSPLFSGKIKGVGPRYCPSIEDKVTKFPDKDRHQIFLEPEGIDTSEIYANGISTSLPLDVQIEFLHTIPGLEVCEIMRPGYAVEYDFFPPTQLLPTLQTKIIKNLYHAGQINGTSGYEEAAAQGIMAGINAALNIKKKEPMILKRSEAYIGVLIDDLVTKGTNEPYRLFTSRAEYRLLLRQDNSDLRLKEYGYKAGIIKKNDYNDYLERVKKINKGISFLRDLIITPNEDTNRKLTVMGIKPIRNPTTGASLLKRPGISISEVFKIAGKEGYLKRLGTSISALVETEIKYSGYIERQKRQADRLRQMENAKLSPSMDYSKIPGLKWEEVEKLNSIKPLSISQASRISGITPSAISILLIYLERVRRENKKNVSRET